MSGLWIHGVIRAACTPPAAAATVIKFGGSLLVRPAWPDELHALLSLVPGPVTLVVGGGPVVDGLRTIDAACPRPAAVMHRLAIEAMGLTARLVAAAAGMEVDSEPSRGGCVVLDVPAWLSRGDQGPALPAGWHVTSDSIAAAVAASASGTLVLAKSVPPPASGDDLPRLAHAGWTDAHFPIVAARLDRIEWVSPTGIIPTSSR